MCRCPGWCAGDWASTWKVGRWFGVGVEAVCVFEVVASAVRLGWVALCSWFVRS